MKKNIVSLYLGNDDLTKYVYKRANSIQIISINPCLCNFEKRMVLDRLLGHSIFHSDISLCYIDRNECVDDKFILIKLCNLRVEFS